MNKKLGFLVVLGLLMTPLAKADTLFLGDGGYNSNTGEKVIWCFSTECYDIKTGAKIPSVTPKVEGVSTVKIHPLLDLPNQGLPHTSTGGVVSDDLKVTCYNNGAYPNGQFTNNIICSNQSRYPVTIKSLLLYIPVKYDGDYNDVTDTLSAYNALGGEVTFTSDSSNTVFKTSGSLVIAKVALDISNVTINKNSTPQSVSKLNHFADAILIGVNDQEIIFKVN